MKKEIKAVQDGVGAMGSLAIRYMRDHGVKLVGAVDIDPEKIGKDAGELAGIGGIGVPVEADLAAVLDRTRPDIVVNMTQTSVPDVFGVLKTCAERRINVVTISEDWYWPWRTRSDMADEIDALAKRNGVTILATGIQDVHWSNLGVVLASSCHNLKALKGTNIAFLDELGAEVAKESFAGYSLEEFNKIVSAEKDLRAMAYTEVLYCMAHELRLKVVKETPSRTPIFGKMDVHLGTLGLDLKKGDIIGMNDRVALETAEGVTLSGDWYLKVKEGDEDAINRWEVEGEPYLDLVTKDMHGECTTSICAVNRIPDVLNAAPGLKTVADMPKPVFRSKPFGEYIQ